MITKDENKILKSRYKTEDNINVAKELIYSLPVNIDLNDKLLSIDNTLKLRDALKNKSLLQTSDFVITYKPNSHIGINNVLELVIYQKNKPIGSFGLYIRKANHLQLVLENLQGVEGRQLELKALSKTFGEFWMSSITSFFKNYAKKNKLYFNMIFPYKVTDKYEPYYRKFEQYVNVSRAARLPLSSIDLSNVPSEIKDRLIIESGLNRMLRKSPRSVTIKKKLITPKKFNIKKL